MEERRSDSSLYLPAFCSVYFFKEVLPISRLLRFAAARNIRSRTHARHFHMPVFFWLTCFYWLHTDTYMIIKLCAVSGPYGSDLHCHTHIIRRATTFFPLPPSSEHMARVGCERLCSGIGVVTVAPRQAARAGRGGGTGGGALTGSAHWRKRQKRRVLISESQDTCKHDDSCVSVSPRTAQNLHVNINQSKSNQKKNL